ncbi:MAG: transcription-repair coupling factor, partial [Chloroflexales bacterium]|nr:transcription-repair coupling factor [Chloroflexales bacterium]
LWNRRQALDALRSTDVSGLRPAARDNWDAAIERLDAGEQFEGRPFFAPFYRAKAEQAPEHGLELWSLFAHLGPGTAVAFSEAALLAQTASELAHHAEEQRNALVLANELPETFPRPYLRWNEAIDQAHAPLVDLSNNEFEPAENGSNAVQPADPASAISLFDFQHAIPPGLFTPAELFGGQLKRLVGDIVGRLRAGERVAVISPQVARIQELVDEALAEDEGRRTNDQQRLRNASTHAPGAAPANDSSLPPSSVLRPSSFVLEHGSLDAGFQSAALGLTLYTDAEIFGWRQRRPVAERRRRKDQSASDRVAFLRGLQVGDYVVHIEHGIALYDGLLRRTINGVEREYLSLRYAAADKLYVPVDQVDRVARYIGAGDAAPQLTRLGTQEWERAKRKARSAVQDLAGDLLAIYAARQLHQGFAFSPDNEWQRELEASFPYAETEDQLRVLIDVKADMERPVPMDRLICGDVGFGKTEVALRAAFKAVQDGKQVAVLVPTTVLAQQHYDTFTRRMSAFPLKVEMLSRFRSPKQQDAILADTARGGVDILIGTHRLLSKDVHFKDLGLVVVDEEQRFGVRHKELLKRLRAEVDVLTLTATPIPRTLHMSLAGIRDLSVIDTPPEDRVPIKTYVVGSDDTLIRDSILREIDRSGQVYFVHNRVHSIYHVATHLKRLVPEAEIGVGHGQLDERQLERVMFDFFSGKYDVLVCTTIIESGLDVPNANTIIIDDATHYGLAQLYQLRGRVGRSANRAYAYLLYKPDGTMTEEAQQRLQAIQEATELGAGFRIAMRDLEIRGAGNLLGSEQSGHIAAVGFDLYSRLLEQAVKDLKQQFEQGKELKLFEQQATARRKAAVSGELEPVHDEQRIALDDLRPMPIKVDEKVLIAPLVTLDLPLTAFLPPEYIADEAVRLSVYQRMVEAHTPQEVRALRQELRDRFGEPPEPAAHLLTWLLIKSLALQAGVSSVITTNEEFVVRLPNVTEAERDKLRRRFGRDSAIRVGPQFVRLDRRQLDGNWVPKLESVLELLIR